MKSRLFGLVLLFSLIVIATGAVATEEPSRIVIVPFKMHADRDLSFLQEGIVDMLTSRLSSEDSIVVARKDTDRVLQDLSEPVHEENARAIGTKLEADYVLFGSLTMFGNSISLDAKMVDVHQKRPTLTLFDQSTKIDDVIPQINLFAAEINEKVFGRAVVARRLPEQPQQRPSLYAHPETLMTGSTGGPVQVPGERPAQTAGPGFEKVEGVPSVDTASAGFWKSRNLKMPIKGLALGDVDGDGKAEVVFIDDRKVHVYRFENKRFLKIKEIAGKRNQRLIAVDAADINGNGYAEIFVTTLLASEVIEVPELGEVLEVMNALGISSTPEQPPIGIPEQKPTGTITKETAKALGQALGIQGIILGSVEEYTIIRSSSGSYPEVSLTLRMIDPKTGSVMWAISHTEKGGRILPSILGIGEETLSETAIKATKNIVDTLIYK